MAMLLAPALRLGTLILFRLRDGLPWLEAAVVTCAGWSCIVLVPGLRLQTISLKKIDWVPSTEESPRPAEVFLSAGEEVGEMFEDGELGRLPAAAELRSWLPHARSMLAPATSTSSGCAHMSAFGGAGCKLRCCQAADHGGPHGCEPCNPAANRLNPYLRGGGDPGSGRPLRGQPILPLHAGAGGAPIGGARGLELLRANLGDGGDGVDDVDALDAPGLAHGEILSVEPTQGVVWVVADLLIGIPVGTAVRLALGAPSLRNSALVELLGCGDPVLVLRMPASEAAAFRMEIDEKLLRAAGAVSPRDRGDDRAAKGRAEPAVEEEAIPTVGAHRLIEVPYHVGCLMRLGPREIIEKLRLIPHPVWPLTGPQSLMWVL
jgi:hypothetical protein